MVLVVASFFVGAVLWGVWRVGQWLLQRERAWGDALGAVMAATVLRRDREQTLGVILECSIEALGGLGGTLHLVRPAAPGYVLAHAVNVVQLDWLAALSADDLLLCRSLAAAGPVLLPMAEVAVRWRALASGRDHVLVGMGLGRQALLVLAWPEAHQAERQLPALQAIQRYGEQVLAEFAEIDARAADIQALSASLDHQERLTRTAAHDLANKLAAAQSLLELAGSSGRLQGEEGELVQQAQEQLSLSQPLVDELSDPGRVIETEPLVVEELARLAAAMLARRRRERDVAFTLEIAADVPAVWGERLAVLRVLDNLLCNALKHNRQQPDLRIWLRIRTEGARVVFEVGDTGAGIPAEQLGQLFEFGFRADGTGKVKGHGLGLWSSRRLIEALGGRIWAESTPGNETHFCFALPAVVEESSPEGSKAKSHLRAADYKMTSAEEVPAQKGPQFPMQTQRYGFE
ncbi:MAG: HAMP domain-containing histidine kinase [Anaerolineales bacterium]|nr:HAMP domain-containing histidine kinase [Anaerolineales bacterium]